VLSLLSFFEHSDPLRDFILLLPQMENEMDALLAILLLKPLLEYFWVFNNPVKILQWTLPSQHRTQRVLFSLCLSAHFLDALLAEYLLHCSPQNTCSMPSNRILSDSGLLNSHRVPSSVHLLNAHLAELLRILSDSGLLELSTEFFLQHLVLMLNAHLAELYRILSDSVCNCVSATQPCLQGIQQP
jgi:hypothetical protein